MAKIALAFTHMDQASGDAFRDGRAKKETVFGDARNILENKVVISAGRYAARHLEAHLRINVFYLDTGG